VSRHAAVGDLSARRRIRIGVLAAVAVVLSLMFTVLGTEPTAAATGCDLDGNHITTNLSQAQCDALMAIYAQTGGDTDWIHNTGWQTHNSDPCDWYGVACEAGGTDLAILDLHENGLDGWLSGAFEEFPALGKLDLHGNNLSGFLPDQFGVLGDLYYLDVSDNDLTGDITTAMSGPIGSLTTLQLSDGPGGNGCFSVTDAALDEQLSVLDADWDECASSCTIGGTRTRTDVSQAECDALVAFYNSTDGPNWTDHWRWNTPIDPCTWTGVTCGSTGVTELDLHKNDLAGPVPAEIGDLANLTKLNLDTNAISSIPTEIGDLTELTELSLAFNAISSIPTEIGDLKKVESLALSENDISSIPEQIGGMSALEELYIDTNPFTSLPAGIGNLSNLTDLSIIQGHLTSLPPEIGNLSKLEMLDVTANHLTSLPAEMAGLDAVTSLYLFYNQLTGDITAPLGQLTDTLAVVKIADGVGNNTCLYSVDPTLASWLTVHDAGWNDCEGCAIGGLPVATVATQGECDALVALYDATDGPNWKDRTGWKTPTDPCTWHGVQCDYEGNHGVSFLDLRGNSLSGSVPSAIDGLSNLTHLDLSWNHLISLPPEVGTLSNLDLLWIGRNQCTSLPAEIGDLSNLTHLSVNNNPTGALPPEFAKLTGIEVFEAAEMGLTEIPDWIGTLHHLVGLDIDRNELSGDITVPMSGLKPSLTQLTLGDGPGYNNCLTVTDPTLAGWLTAKDAGWDECASSCTIEGTPVASIATQGECDALVALYDATDGPNWKDHTGWKTKTDPCTWHGVTCNYAGVAGVSKLDLKDNLLEGDVPADIDGLKNLVHANFNDNHLTSLPSEIGSLSKLYTLFLQANALTSLPPEIGNLANLRNLDVSDMDLASLPVTFGNLGKLDVLAASQNHFTTLPDWIGNLPLSGLTLSANQLTGDITTPMAGIRDTAGQIYLSDGPGGNSCLTVTDPPLGWWLSSLDVDWDECPATTPGIDVVVVGGPAAVPNSVLTELQTLTTGTVTRLYGANRYATAAAVSEANFPAGVEAAYIATGANFPDALSAGPVAGRQGAPILLTRKTALPAETAAELTRLKPEKIVVVGGTAVVSNTVMSQLQKYTTGTVTRVAGANRYATAAAMSASAFDPGVGTVLVATGANFPDALTGGPAGVMWDGPVLLVQQNAIPSSTMAELKRLKPGRIVVLGGTSVVSPAVAGQLASLTSGSVLRYAGANRYATAAAVSKAVFPSGSGTVFVSIGTNYPDAVAAGSAAGMLHAPILLVSGASAVPAPTATEVKRLDN